MTYSVFGGTLSLTQSINHPASITAAVRLAFLAVFCASLAVQLGLAIGR